MFLTEATERTEMEGKNTKTLSENICAYANIFRQHCFSLSVPSVRSVRDASGFSLIEVLVAMAIMTVVIVMVTNMFRDASEAWDIGTQRAEMNTSARAAISFMASELQSAIAGPIETTVSPAAAYLPFRLDGDGLKFCALSQTPGGGARAVRGVLFYTNDNYNLMYNRESVSFDGYTQPWYEFPWGISQIGSKLLITNVWSFRVDIYSNESDMISGNARSTSYASSVLPACVDISIEMLCERDLARALSLTAGTPRDGYVMTNSRVYTTRVCFPNRGGK